MARPPGPGVVQGVVLPGGEGRAGFPCGGQGQPERQLLEPGHRRDQLHRDDGPESDVVRQLAHTLDRLVPDDRHGRAVVFELVAQLPVRVQRIVFHHDGPETHHGVEGNDVLRAIRQDQGHPVSGPDTELLEAGRGPADLRAQFAVARPRPEELQGRLGSEALNGSVHQVHEGAPGKLEVRGDARPVVLCPRALRADRPPVEFLLHRLSLPLQCRMRSQRPKKTPASDYAPSRYRPCCRSYPSRETA